MDITILGNGGGVNEGLPYNAFLIDDTFLCETPPDIMLSLSREKCDLRKIKLVYISHFHADHYFGFPFVVLNAMVQGHGGFKIIGPKPLKDTLNDITVEAFGAETPFPGWLREKCTFFEIEDGRTPADRTPPGGSTFDVSVREKLTFYHLEHFMETYGFLLMKNGAPLFAYLPDTLWCESMKLVLEQCPSFALVDLNGATAEANKVHFSEADLLEYAVPITGEKTKYLGTHLMRYKKSEIDQLEYTVPGMKVTIPDG